MSSLHEVSVVDLYKQLSRYGIELPESMLEGIDAPEAPEAPAEENVLEGCSVIELFADVEIDNYPEADTCCWMEPLFFFSSTKGGSHVAFAR